MASRFMKPILRNNVKLSSFVNKQAPAVRHMSAQTAFEESLRNVPETELTTLNSGLKVASENTGGATCTVGLWIDAGSRYEMASNNGVAHFLEHMVFKGTHNRSQQQLEMEIESMGGHLNAHTGREQTAYYAKCFTKDLPQAVNILADLVQNSVLDEGVIEQERGVILREMNEIDSNQEEVIMDHLHATAYQGTPLSMSTLGPSKNVRSLQKSDLQQYVNTHYTAPRICLAAAGGVDHGELTRLAEENFSTLSTEYSEAAKIKAVRFTGSDIRVRDDDIPLAHIAMAVEGCGWASPDYFPLMIANSIFGTWNRALGGAKSVGGELARDVSENGLAQHYQSFNTCYTDTGLWGAYFIGDRMLIEDMMYVVQREWMRLCTGVTDAEVSRAKNLLKTNLLLSLDGSTGNCGDIGRQVLAYGRRIPLPELMHRIDMVDAAMVKESCNKYIYDRCPALAAVGPVEGVPDYNRIRGSMYWLRV